MSACRFPNIMSRRQGDFGSVLNSLRFSSSSGNDISGLDEALQKFAEKKALVSKRHRGPIEGIPDDDSVAVEFEYAEDAMVSCASIIGEDDGVDAPNKLSNSAPHDVSLPKRRLDSFVTKVSSSAPGTSIQRQTSRRLRRARPFNSYYRYRRPRTTSPSGTGHPSVYLKPVDIFGHLLSPSPRTPVKGFPSTTAHGALIINDNKNNYTEASFCISASLPDFHEKNGSLHFKCSVSSDMMHSKKLTDVDSDKVTDFLEYESQPTTATAPPLPSLALPPQLFETSAVSIPSEAVSDVITHSMSAEEEVVPPDRPIRRCKNPLAIDKTTEEISSSVATDVISEPTTKASSSFALEPIQTNINHIPQKEVLSEEDPDTMESQRSILFGLITRELLQILKKWTILVFAIFSITAFLLWYCSVYPLLSGALLGGGIVFIVMRFWSFVLEYLNSYSPEFHSEDCIFTRGGHVNLRCTSPTATCCTLHNTLLADWRPAYRGPLILPQLRSLQAPPLPQLADEDPKTGPFSGPLGESLGYKLDKNNQPVYQAWMNEAVSYSSETYHINNTHSVFVTLEGTHLRIQRPRKNVPRRAMFNVPVPSSSGVHFVHQRIYDMSRVTVSLLPEGLVAKRLWSKKYPICLTVLNEQNFQPKGSKDTSTNMSSVTLRKPADPHVSRTSSSVTTSSTVTAPVSCDETKATLEGLSAYSVSTSRFLRVSTTPSVGTCAPINSADVSRKVDDAEIPITAQSQDDFLLVQPSDLDDKIYLFARTCREKETWFRRLYGASIGKPMLLTTQQAFKRLENFDLPRIKPTNSVPQIQISTSLSDVTASKAASRLTVGSVPVNATVAASNSVTQHSITTSTDDFYDPELQVTYLRYMAKFMPAAWLLRASQALKLNLNYVKPDIHLPWLNALIARLSWDFLKHERWRKRIQEKIQAKLRKKKFISLLNEPIVTNVDMGSELPVIRSVGKPFLDNQGLWLELEIVYTGGFTVSVETTVNIKKLEKASRQDVANGQSGSPTLNNSSGGIPPPTLFEPLIRGSAAFLSGEEDSADSSTDSDRENTLTKAFASFIPASNALDATASGPFGTNPNASTKMVDPNLRTATETEEPVERGTPKGRFHRIFDKITRSIYFQVADSKLVQYSLDFVTQMTLHLQLEVSLLHGTLLVNLPPPPSNRLWYGFRGNPNLRLKVKPKVGEYLFNFPRILEVIEKRIVTEFQRVVVLPNMDDLVLPMLIPEETLEHPNSSQSKSEASRNNDVPIPPQHMLWKSQEPSEQADVAKDSGLSTKPPT